LRHCVFGKMWRCGRWWSRDGLDLRVAIVGGRAFRLGEEEEDCGSLGEGSWLAWCWSVHGIRTCVTFCSVAGCSGFAWKLYCDLNVCGFLCCYSMYVHCCMVVTVENFFGCCTIRGTTSLWD
jgi:hypothetical protein